MAGPVVVPVVTQSYTQSTLDFTQPAQHIRPGPKSKESFLAPICRSVPAASVANVTNAANEAVLYVKSKLYLLLHTLTIPIPIQIDPVLVALENHTLEN